MKMKRVSHASGVRERKTAVAVARRVRSAPLGVVQAELDRARLRPDAVADL